VRENLLRERDELVDDAVGDAVPGVDPVALDTLGRCFR
jgi:hypothetical protein